MGALERPGRSAAMALCGALAACAASSSGVAVDGGRDAPIDGGEQGAADAGEASGDANALESDAGTDAQGTGGGPADAATGDSGMDATNDGSSDANTSLGSGAVCDTSYDKCGTGLKCCYSPGHPLD